VVPGRKVSLKTCPEIFIFLLPSAGPAGGRGHAAPDHDGRAFAERVPGAGGHRQHSPILPGLWRRTAVGQTVQPVGAEAEATMKEGRQITYTYDDAKMIMIIVNDNDMI
jgi:hypothetical protein